MLRFLNFHFKVDLRSSPWPFVPPPPLREASTKNETPRQDSLSFIFADEKLKLDREFLMLAMACNGRALQHLSFLAEMVGGES